MESALLDVCGRRRSPATLRSYHSGRPPMNKGLHYPADPPSVEESVAASATPPQPSRPHGHVEAGVVHARPAPVIPAIAGLRATC